MTKGDRRPIPIRPSGPLPPVVVAGPFRWRGTTVQAAPGHVYKRDDPGAAPASALVL